MRSLRRPTSLQLPPFSALKADRDQSSLWGNDFGFPSSLAGGNRGSRVSGIERMRSTGFERNGNFRDYTDDGGPLIPDFRSLVLCSFLSVTMTLKRSLLRISLVVSTVCPVPGAVVPVPDEIVVERRESGAPRNVVFILSDDHRFDAMSFMGHPLAQTPNLDRLAAEGVHLRNALVTTSLCSPSRASILTGLYTFRHRVIDNNRRVPDGTLFFPQYLQKAGYATAFIGKWHMGGESDEPRPGFDHWVSFRGQGNYLPPSPDYTLNVDGERVPQKGYITDELTDYAVDWLQERNGSDQPFFLYLSHKAAHAGFVPAERHAGQFADRAWSRPATETLTAESSRLQPRWLRDQRNSWHGVDFPYHSELDIEAYARALPNNCIFCKVITFTMKLVSVGNTMVPIIAPKMIALKGNSIRAKG